MSATPTPPQYFKLSRSLFAKALLASLPLALAVTLVVRTNSRATAQSTPGSTQTVFFAYFSVDNGFNSSVVLNNASVTQLTVQPMLYNLSGQPLTVSQVVLAPRQEITANIADWVIQGGGGAAFKAGSLSLSYDAPDASYLGTQVSVVNTASSLSFDVPSENPAGFASSRLEGMWWQQDDASQYNLVLSNTAGSSVAVSASFTGEQGFPSPTSLDVTLGPHQTQVLNLKDMKLPFGSSEGTGKVGGISITHSGKPGAVLAYGMLAKSEVGFSSHFVFSDPATSGSQTLAAAHLLVGKADLPGFSEQTSFTSIALLRNGSDAPIEVTPKVSFKSNGAPRGATLPVRHLAAQQAEAVDIAVELKRVGIRGPFVGTGLTLTSTGQAGSLVVHITSFDQTGNHTFDVPLKDPAVRSSRYGGSYPWRIDGDLQSIVHVRNTTDEKARFTIQLDFDGGSYALPMQVIEPQQEVAIDIRQLRDSQTQDSIGRVIPMEVTSGQATWSERGPQALIGRIEVFNASAAVASSLSCEVSCCPPSTEGIFVAPASFSGVIGDSFFAQAFETQRRACDGAQFGPFDVTGLSSWTSDNTAVATVLLGDVSCVGIGLANVSASFQGTGWFPDPATAVCSDFPFTVSASCPVDVKPHIKSISPARGVQGIAYGVTITGTGFIAPASVSLGGAGITVSDVVVGSSTEILATFTLAADATGGNHAVTVRANNQNSDNSVNFSVQIPTTIRQDSLDPITTCDPTRCTIGNQQNACGAFRLVHYTLVDQANPAQAIVEMATVTETVKDLSVPNDPGTPKSIPTNEAGAFDDLLALFKTATCPSPGETASVSQTFTATVGNKTFPLSRVNRIDYAKSQAGSYSITITVQTQ